MKLKNVLLIILLFVNCLTYSLTISNTYSAGDISTTDGAYDPTCNGPTTPLVVTLPTGGPWIVTSVDVEYNMSSPNAGGGFMSEQRSRLSCQNTGLNEGADFSGVGASSGTFPYNRPGLNIANGQFAGGTNLIFELQAFRTSPGTAGCNTIVALIDDGTWIVTVHYELAVPMLYVSSNTIQSQTTNVQNCITTAQIIQIEVETSGTLAPLDLTQLNLTTNGSTNLSEISDVNVYYTGTSNNFSNVNLFGTSISGTNVNISGMQSLEPGINYFWVEYVLIAPTTVGNLLDGTCNSITVNGSAEIPSSINPSGDRSIGICNPSPGGIDTNLKLWLDAKNGAESGGNPAVTTNQVDKWVNRVTNPGLVEVNQTITNQQPIFIENSLNFNPVIEFDGINDELEQMVQGTDLFNATDNTIIMVHRAHGGVVYFKWEQSPSGNRVGYHFMTPGDYMRFDFPKDDANNQSNSNFSFDPNGDLVTVTTELGANTIRYMGEFDALNNTTGTLDINHNSNLTIGENSAFNLPTNIDYSEIIVN